MSDIIQLKITLQDTEPPIWRTVQVDKNISFFDLHHIIQISMGWTNSHLFEFMIHGYKIGWMDKTNEFENPIDANNVILGLTLTNPKETFDYIYDFGDDWTHLIELEGFLPADTNLTYPICIDGALACPKENCHGVDGHYHNLEIIKDTEHPEYADTKRWLGRGYNPNKFDIDKVNKELPKFKKWMNHWKK